MIINAIYLLCLLRQFFLLFHMAQATWLRSFEIKFLEPSIILWPPLAWMMCKIGLDEMCKIGVDI